VDRSLMALLEALRAEAVLSPSIRRRRTSIRAPLRRLLCASSYRPRDGADHLLSAPTGLGMGHEPMCAESK
jgi:hypothetical protein